NHCWQRKTHQSVPEMSDEKSNDMSDEKSIEMSIAEKGRAAETIFYVLDYELPFVNEAQTGLQIFFPGRKYKQTENIPQEGICAVFKYAEEAVGCGIYIAGEMKAEGFCAFSKLSEKNETKRRKLALKRAVFSALSPFLGYKPPWGILTGIRPAKLAGALLSEGSSKEAAISFFEREYLVFPEKAELAYDVACASKKFSEPLSDAVSIYIGIPYCPSRCLYCSFISQTVRDYKKQIIPYIAALTKELKAIGEMLEGKRLDTIYIGGGTPTVLEAEELKILLETIKDNFNLEYLREFTVEAGRPDTLSDEKLAVMKAFGVNRLSVNPQSMNEKTLAVIGRTHSTKSIEDAFYAARKAGFDNINMDMIVGLPGEEVSDVEKTLEKIRKLNPENLTVHTLSVKRASKLNEYISDYSLAQSRTVEEMLKAAHKTALEMGLKPYYMYRQKNMLGSFENVGYARPGFEGLYNVLIMEETETIIAAGEGGVTKTVEPGGKIERIFNVKSPSEYISRIDEMIERKKGRIF
ncbi:MAG: coproporphyrinogen dehydrogenase HemZ, partial [Firmicutes bacterium]|nr:coproporphyrinogen dehydrogenase HemZ [Bacillota bacterium]